MVRGIRCSNCRRYATIAKGLSNNLVGQPLLLYMAGWETIDLQSGDLLDFVKFIECLDRG